MPHKHRKTILVVDDDKLLLEAVNGALSRKYNVIVSSEGHEAIELARHHNVDLILLDIMMPGFDGMSTLLLLRDDEETCDIPVIMLTAVGKKEQVVEAFREGAAGYILKPFKPDLLLQKIADTLAAKPPPPEPPIDEPPA